MSTKKHYVFLRRLSDNACWGGCENRLRHYFKQTDFDNNRVTLLTTHDIYSREFSKCNIPVNVSCLPLSGNSGFIGRIRHLYRILKELKPDYVVFVQGSFLDFHLPEFLAGTFTVKRKIFSLDVSGVTEYPEKNSKSHLGIIRGLGLWRYKEILFRSLRGWLCKSILVVSEESKEKMIYQYRYPKNRVITVFTGIDTMKFVKDESIREKMRRKLSIAESETVIVSTARFSKEKGVDRLINAFDQLSTDQNNCRLILIGDGPLRKRLKKLVGEKACKDRINFLGYLENVDEYLKMSDIYVLPSDIEGIASALLEAMACGLICVATKTSGPSRFIQDGTNGFLVEISEQGILDGLEKAISCTDVQRQEMTRCARKLVEDQFATVPDNKNAVKILGLTG